MLERLKRRFRALFFRSRMESELQDELRFHLEREIEENIARGMSKEGARYAALRSFGGVERVKEESRDTRSVRFIEDLWQDDRYGARMLIKAPGFTTIAVVALALGIGGNSAIFSIVNAVLLKPLPYSDPERLVDITESKMDKEGGLIEGDIGIVDYILWREKSQVFDQLVAFNRRNISLAERGELERLDAVWVTSNIFSTLGISPQLGRVFTPEEDGVDGRQVVILSYSIWQQRFAGDPAILGKTLRLDKESRQVIGVMPPGFKFIQKTDVLLPLAIDVNLEMTRNRDGSRYLLDNIIGRLKPGISIKQGRIELNSILSQGKRDDPKLAYYDKAIVLPLNEKLVGPLYSGLILQFGAVAFILLIACANVANLILARSQVRQKEMAIRAAMGASRGRLVRQILTESLLLSLCGGVAGFFLTLLSIKALAPMIPNDLAHLKESSVDITVLGFTFFASLLTSIFVGIIPALQTSKINLNDNIKESTRGGGFSKNKKGWQISPVLVISELALTLVLLIGAGLLIKSFLLVRAVKPGYNQENLLTMSIPLSKARYKPEQKKVFYEELLSRINRLPDVKAAAVGLIPQVSGGGLS